MTNPFAGKTPTERNKLIAAIVLGVLALSALYITFGGSLFGSKTTVTAVKPTPKPKTNSNTPQATVPTTDEIIFGWTTTPVVYNPGATNAPDPGRNIFAFYEPPKPTPYVAPVATPFIPPTPTPYVEPEPPKYDYIIGYANPQNVYEGQNTFRLEVNGTQFTPDSYILFNGQPLPTTFISPEKLVAEVPANLILSAGPRQLSVASGEGKFSNQLIFTVQAKPTPQFKYIGMIARKRYNNDTAYFEEPGKQQPTSARLSDVLGGRFKLVSISSKETIFEDTSLGFRHRVPLFRPAPGEGGATSGSSGYPNVPTNGFPINPNPNNINPIPPPSQNTTLPDSIPGIPDSVRRPNRNNGFPQPTPQTQDDNKKDEDGDN